MENDYLEQVEESHQGNLGGEASPVVKALIDEDDDQGQHESVSSESDTAGEADIEAPEVGEGHAPDATDDAVEIEPVSGYDESVVEMDRAESAAHVDESHLLDAWYAEYGDPVTMSLMLQQRTLTEAVMEVVIGADDRVRITNTTAYPWRSICSLLITANDGSRWIGTGWLVGPGTVITAGHCVYIHGRGGWVSSIEVIPGRNGAARPYGSCTSSNFRSVKGWTQNSGRNYDYGAIILPSNCKYGNQLGYFGYANLGYFSLWGLKGNLSGYPGDKPTGTQWFHARAISAVTARTLVYNIDTAGGQSGSPVWRLKSGKRHVVGIHTNGSPMGNSATRIVKAVFNNIKNWKAQGS